MEDRNLNYEKKIRAYLFKGNFQRHKAICKNFNVKPNITEPNYKKAYHLLMQYFDSIAEEEQKSVSRELEKLGL